MLRRTVYWFAGLAGLWLSGCSDDFEPRTLLNSHAVVGIELSPPEVGMSDTLRVAVHEYARPGVELEHRWSLCLYSYGPGVGYECAQDAPEISLSNEAEFLLDLGPAGIDLRALWQAQGVRPYADGTAQNLERGFDVWLTLRSGPQGDASCRDCNEIVSVKRLTIRENSMYAANANPEIGELKIEGDLRVGQTVELSIESDLPEEYVVPRNSEPRTEEYLYTWYTTAGETLPGLTFGVTQHTELQLPEEPGSLQLVVAVRDGRGGLAVARRIVEVE